MAKRKRRPRHTTRPDTSPLASLGPWASTPSAQTLFRMRLLGSDAQDLLSETIGRVRPQILERDQPHIDRIERAATAEELLDLAGVATGLADRAWYRRLQGFDSTITPLIARRLEGARALQDPHTQSAVYEHLLGALGFYGDAGIEAVLACFDALDDYAASQACIVLGHLGARDQADRLWDFYQRVKRDIRENYFVGPLWGLVDLQDLRAADALDELLWAERFFYASFPMAYRAGDARLVLPLLYAFVEGGDELQDLAIMALAGLAHRVGPDALLAELQSIGANTGVSPEQHQAIADRVLALPARAVDQYFAVFFAGFERDDIDAESIKAKLEAMERVKPLLSGAGLRRKSPPLPGQKPGRNDPCWCGSGQKYKHCHSRRDQTTAA